MTAELEHCDDCETQAACSRSGKCAQMKTGADRLPAAADIRHDDHEYNPRLAPNKSKAWLNLLKESEKAFEQWNDHCDKIEKTYANIERLAGLVRDKEFQMFWANVEVIKPTIYALPPKPVVVPKFKDRRPVYQAASEVMERCAVVAFDLAHIHDLMKLIRDDVVLIGRGVPWCRYESAKDGKYDHEKVCIDYKHRKDFLHSVSRNWSEVTWVAAASYLTRDEARERFYETSGDAYQEADFKVDRDAKEVGGADDRERAAFWEIWDKANRRVLWVAEGVEDILDEDDPHLDLTDFFPCPRPAYGTLQRGSLVPVPDVLMYKDQLDELNLLTARIHALSDALEAKGFYPAGGAELGDAVQAAIANKTPGRLLVPISNWAAFGGSKEVIIWMPIAEIAQTVTALVQLRKEIIQDIYQITGLSDIMRGSTDARETLGAQQLKQQFGSTRVRDKQEELVRVARDLVILTCDIITEKFDPVTIIEMSQTQLPTREMQEQAATELQQQLAQQERILQLAPQVPQFQQMQQQNPQLMQQATALVEEGKKSLQAIMAQPTIDQVLAFFDNNRAKSFVLDIETDSTIVIDEQTEKQRRSEFVGMLAQLIPQLAQLIQLKPQTAEFCGEILKFAAAPFRAGRELDGAIDRLALMMEAEAGKPQGPDPITQQSQTDLQIEQMKLARQQARDQQDAAAVAAKLKQEDEHKKLELESNERIERAKLEAARQDDMARARQTNLKAMADREKHQMDIIGKQADIEAGRQKAQLAVQQSQLKARDMAQRANERANMMQFKQQQAAMRPPPGARP